MATTTIVASNPHHRKIELQSPLDLTHLQSQLSTCARAKLDLHFPPSALRSKPATHISLGPSDPASSSAPGNEGEEDDPLRAHVQRLTDAFLHRTWSGAASSISINGLDAHALPQFAATPPTTTTSTIPTTGPQTQQPPNPTNNHLPPTEREGIDFTYSPYDSRLQTRLAELYGELESLTAQVSKRRRQAPASGAEAYEAALRRELAEDEANHEAEVARARDLEQSEEIMKGRVGLREGWHEDVRRAYEEATVELARLSGMKVEGVGEAGGGLTATVGKVQRAVGVAEELE